MAVDRGIVAYFAPGAGLGHLNRALATCLQLRDEGVDARIVTNSPMAEGLAALSRCPVVQIESERWSELARRYVDETAPRVVVTDTFPYGLRDEWHGVSLRAAMVHVARRLLQPIQICREDFAHVIQAEPLSDDHCTAITPSVVLSGPIMLQPGRIVTPIPEVLDRDDLTLVVHSGPDEEVAALVALAEPPYVVISPWSGIEYYPAQNLYARARRVITGAGYNSMADLLVWRDKHVAVPFARTFDDQHARVRRFFSEPGDGTGEVVRGILEVV